MNQAIARRPIFEDAEDLRYFLSQLAVQHVRGRWSIVAFSLMTTHYHLVVESHLGELAAAMRELQGNYTRRFNFRRERSGPLVRRRYLSKEVDSDTYFHTLIPYVDANPVAAGMVKSSEQHMWGSARLHQQEIGPVWLCRERLWRHIRLYTDEQTFAGGYQRLFSSPVSEEQSDWVERRLRSPEEQGGFPELDDLVRGAPSDVQRWLRARAELADGVGQAAPAASTRALGGALAEVRQAGGIVGLKGTRSRANSGGPWGWMHAGLLRQLCAAPWTEVALLIGRATSTCVDYAARHDREFAESGAYREAAGDVTRRALARSTAFRLSKVNKVSEVG